jgi:hypothetical protein
LFYLYGIVTKMLTHAFMLLKICTRTSTKKDTERM